MAGSFNDQKTGVSAPSGDYCLEVVLDSSEESNRYKTQEKNATNLAYVHEHFQLVSGLDDGSSFKVSPLFDSGGNPVAYFVVSRSGSTYSIEFQCYSGGSWQTDLMTPETISTGTWYRLQYKYDLVDMAWVASVATSADSPEITASGDLTSTTRTPTTLGVGIYDCDQTSSNDPTTYHDRVVFRIDDWQEEPKSLIVCASSTTIEFSTNGSIYRSTTMFSDGGIEFETSSSLGRYVSILSSGDIEFVTDSFISRYINLVSDGTIEFVTESKLERFVSLLNSATIEFITSPSLSPYTSIVSSGDIEFITSAAISANILMKSSSDIEFFTDSSLSNFLSIVSSGDTEFTTESILRNYLGMNGSGDIEFNTTGEIRPYVGIFSTSTGEFVTTASRLSYKNLSLKSSGQTEIITEAVLSVQGFIDMVVDASIEFVTSGELSQFKVVQSDGNIEFETTGELSQYKTIEASANIEFVTSGELVRFMSILSSSQIEFLTSASISRYVSLLSDSQIEFVTRASRLSYALMSLVSSGDIEFSIATELLKAGFQDMAINCGIAFETTGDLGRYVGLTLASLGGGEGDFAGSLWAGPLWAGGTPNSRIAFDTSGELKAYKNISSSSDIEIQTTAALKRLLSLVAGGDIEFSTVATISRAILKLLSTAPTEFAVSGEVKKYVGVSSSVITEFVTYCSELLGRTYLQLSSIGDIEIVAEGEVGAYRKIEASSNIAFETAANLFKIVSMMSSALTEFYTSPLELFKGSTVLLQSLVQIEIDAAAELKQYKSVKALGEIQTDIDVILSRFVSIESNAPAEIKVQAALSYGIMVLKAAGEAQFSATAEIGFWNLVQLLSSASVEFETSGRITAEYPGGYYASYDADTETFTFTVGSETFTFTASSSDQNFEVAA